MEYALKVAKENGVKTILNPAPARDIGDEILKNADFITPNETEFELICRKSIEDNKILEKEMINWQDKHQNTRLIVTRGKEGSSYVENNAVKTVKAITVKVTDTTGAGDTFNGALAHGIINNYSMENIIGFAGTAASLSVTKLGAQTGMPTLEEVNKIYINKELEELENKLYVVENHNNLIIGALTFEETGDIDDTTTGKNLEMACTFMK